MKMPPSGGIMCQFVNWIPAGFFVVLYVVLCVSRLTAQLDHNATCLFCDHGHM